MQGIQGERKMRSPYWERVKEERERVGVDDTGEWLKQNARNAGKKRKK